MILSAFYSFSGSFFFCLKHNSPLAAMPEVSRDGELQSLTNSPRITQRYREIKMHRIKDLERIHCAIDAALYSAVGVSSNMAMIEH